MNPFVKHFWMVSCCLLMLAACTENDQLIDRSDDDWFDVAVQSSSMVSNSANITCGTPKIYTLCAGQYNTYGNVYVSNDDKNIIVTYQSTNEMQDLHLWIGDSYMNIPGNNNPAPGLFPYKKEGLNGKEYTFTIPMSDLTKDGSGCYDLVAHAAMADGETAYASNYCPIVDRTWNNWAQYIEYCPSPCLPDGGNDPICETGFAYLEGKATCFLNIAEIKNNRWGWVIGPLGAGTHLLPVYAGAGQCDRSKGVQVATAVVKYVGGKVSLTFMDVHPDYQMDEWHFNVSNIMSPKTTAPGRYNCNTGECSATGNIYVIVHTGCKDSIIPS